MKIQVRAQSAAGGDCKQQLDVWAHLCFIFGEAFLQLNPYKYVLILGNLLTIIQEALLIVFSACGGTRTGSKLQ